MDSVRLRGQSEKFGPVSTSEEFLTWEVPDIESTGRMRRLLSDMGRSSMVLDKTKYGGINVDKHAHASFIEKDEFAGGRNESAHQVRFGQLILNGRDFRELPELVAVKPFDDRAGLYKEWAAHEYLNSLADRQIGYINLGVHNDADGVESIVSQYDHDVTTFDSSFWADSDDPDAAIRPEILQRDATLGAQGLGFLHGVGMTHGDAQVKNLAADRFGFRAVDLEGAEILNTEALHDVSALTETGRDIAVFIDSMRLVEENRDRIIAALSPAKVRERIAKSYIDGTRQGRALTDKNASPDFGLLNVDRIHSELDRLTK